MTPSLRSTMPATEALQHYLISLRRMTGAESASVLLWDPSAEHTAMVFHEGELSPLPELETQGAVSRFLSQAERTPVEKDELDDRAMVRCQESVAEHGYLLRISVSRFIQTLTVQPGSAPRAERRKTAGTVHAPGFEGVVWIGLRYASAPPSQFRENLSGAMAPTIGEIPATSGDWLAWTLAQGGYMAWQAYQLSHLQQDPVTQLPGRIELQTYLQRKYEKGLQERGPLALLMLNPDDFGLVNQRLGREKGDEALREVAARLSSCMRRSDKVFRYGGAIFSIVLPGTGTDAAQAAAEKLRRALTHHPFLNEAARFAFSIGMAVYEPGDGAEVLSDSAELLRRADQALNVAKLSGGGRSVLWQPDGTTTAVGHLDRLSGIFTADTEKDYRNMLLLWDAITVISSWTETEAIAKELVNRIGSTLKPERVALYAGMEGEEPRLLAANQGESHLSERVNEKVDFSLSGQQIELINKARQSKRTERMRLVLAAENQSSRSAKNAHTAYAVPLVARDRSLGCLYIDGTEPSLVFDSSDLMFLNALASQIAVAVDRAELASRWKQEKERESLRLREEVRELRQALRHSKLVYQSTQMESVLETLRKVAPTDVTVLITGESGTGKEMLARALHELGSRHDKPFVTVDCGAIAHSLMDTELFGHVKGAYTGAQASSAGRILQAQGGTLFLDEVGEIPLEVQAKLLRFLQEKEITPVGATRSQFVDVRIVAATNRELKEEVAAGRFRADLYYRLQVVGVNAPPLRERPDDILPLARYFLETFCVQYGKSQRRLTPAAETRLLEHRWPGNVRELQHRVLQAVVMSDTEEIGWSELNVGTPMPVAIAQSAAADEASVERFPEPRQPGTLDAASPPGEHSASAEAPESTWEALRKGLERQVTLALDNSNGSAVPLGRWLAEDLVLAADNASKGTARRASSALGMAETTFRRRLEKAKRELDSGLYARTDAWSGMRPILTRLVTSPEVAKRSKVFEDARNTLLEVLSAREDLDGSVGSALMGVTLPTYRRWMAALSSEA